ncbi:hypothetical protein DFH06DRAFT_1014211 [Mycena polygramma]|nr:hypothetical protein DFH06DRAFT_1014211 [Mycena polygramma]
MLPTPAHGPDDLLRALGIDIPSSHTSSSSLGRYSDLFKPEDSVVRAVLNGFVELGEGTVHHVVVVAGERGWLRARTRWEELMRQAMAARRWGDGTGAATTLDSDIDLEMDEEEEGAVALEMTVKEMALTDWARGRILDGAWTAPADVYFGYRVNGVRAVHPVSWAVSQPPSPPHSSSAHPAEPVPIPPTYGLTEAAHTAHCRQLRVVLLPPFRNVVRRVIVECALDAAEADAAADGDVPDTRARRPLDPAIRAARMSLAEVVAQLRGEEQVWFDGIDWSETRKNARERTHRSEGSDDSCAGTPRTSDTSPGLSTSTPGTTPSPPPLGERDRKAKDAQRREQARQPMIAVAPVLNPPRLLRPIPYVPETLDHLPQYSIEALKAVSFFPRRRWW